MLQQQQKSSSSSPHSYYIFRCDPCGIICILITYLAIIYSDYVIIKYILLINYYNSIIGSIHCLIYNLIILLLLISHVRAVVSDPGLVEKNGSGQRRMMDEDGEDGEDGWSVCGRCESYRPPRAHHCRICKRCVRKMDHHCPWINNCVGEWNQKYFIQFLFYVGLLSIYASVLVIWSWTMANECEYCPKDLMGKQTKILHSVLLILESLLFGMFVLAIMIDQLTAIWSDETAVEHVKNRHFHRNQKTTTSTRDGSTANNVQHLPRLLVKRPKMQLLGDVCGRGPLYMWLLPCRQDEHYIINNKNKNSRSNHNVNDYNV